MGALYKPKSQKAFFIDCLIIITLLIVSLMFSCSSDDSNPDPSDDGESAEAASLINEFSTYLNSNTFISVTTTDCNLVDGTSTACYQVTFSANPYEIGPFCPATEDEVGGTTVWDGPTNLELYAVGKSLIETLEADGWDMVDDDGNVYIVYEIGDNNIEYNPCVELTFDREVTKTWYIPVSPKEASVNQSFSDVEDIGVSIDGIKFSEQPSSYENEMVIALAVLDRCGGHVDPDGSFHWHQIPQAVNQLYDENEITEVSCLNVSQSSTGLIGWAKDGFPIYSYQDEDGTIPTDLDECNGHIGSVPDYDADIYHYHAATTGSDNMPKCLHGVAVDFFGGTSQGPR